MKTYSVPISVKGIVFENGKVWLRKNEREEWELPGGKIEENEQPEETLIREVQEELGFEVKPIKIVGTHLHKIKNSIYEKGGVLVISYLCKILSKKGDFETQGETGLAKFGQFPIEEIPSLKMPEYYKKMIKKAHDKY